MKSTQTPAIAIVIACETMMYSGSCVIQKKYCGCVKPLMEKIESQTEAIIEQKRLISDQERQIVDQQRQLRLLPDLQKQAEEQRQGVELKHVENEALKKQVAALQEQLDAARRPWWKKWFESPEQVGKAE